VVSFTGTQVAKYATGANVPSCFALTLKASLVAGAFLNICVGRHATHVRSCRCELFLDEAKGHDLLWVMGVSDTRITDMSAGCYTVRVAYTADSFIMLHIFLLRRI
jgi:hypothetical protein